MSTTSTFNFNIVTSAGGVLGNAVCTVIEREIDVAASLSSTTLTLPAGTWRVSSRIGSSPFVGCQKHINTQPSDVTISSSGSVVVPASVSYHCLKDFEHGVGGTVRATVEVLQFVSGNWVYYASGSGSFNFGASSTSLTNQIWGINAHPFGVAEPTLPTDWSAAITAAADLGFTAMRVGPGWTITETARGVFDDGSGGSSAFGSATSGTVVWWFDTFIAQCTAAGISVLAPLGGGVPTWVFNNRGVYSNSTAYAVNDLATTAGWPHVCIQANTGQPQTNTAYWTPAIQYTFNGTAYFLFGNRLVPPSWADYENFVTWFVNRYKSHGLIAVESVNEPNSTTANMSAATTALWQQHLYTGARASAPASQVKVIGGALSFGDTTYLNSLYAAGWAGSYDAVSFHPYPMRLGSGSCAYPPRVPAEDDIFVQLPCGASAFADVALSNDPTVRLWVTEMGVSSGYSAIGNRPEQEQGPDLAYWMRLLSRVQHIDAVFLHTIEDVGKKFEVSPVSWNNFGMLQTDWTSRKLCYPIVKQTLTNIRSGMG